MITIHPCRPDRMNDILGIKVKGICADSLSRRNFTDLFALRQKLLLTGSCIDCAVGTATNAWLGISRIDDGICFNLCDIVPNDLKWHHYFTSWSRCFWLVDESCPLLMLISGFSNVFKEIPKCNDIVSI